MSKLKIVIQATAGYVNELWGHGCPKEGMKRMAALAHHYGLPITWSVNARSAQEMKDELTAWHQQYGDDVSLWLKPADLEPIPENERRYTKFGLPVSASKELFSQSSFEVIRQVVAKELKAVEEALPWAAPIRTAANMDRSSTLVRVLEDLNFVGLWGYLWQHKDTDGLTDAGCPYNLFYVSKKSFKCPADYPGKVVGAHWFSYDMTNTYHSRATSVFTNDPNDVLRAKLCDGRDIEYWKVYFEVWKHNAQWNDFLYYMFHQEAHEMEYSDVCRSYTPQQIENTIQMMDEFFKFISQQDVDVLTLPQLVQSYKKQMTDTIPTYFFSPQIKIDRPVDYYDFDFFQRPKPPPNVKWPDSFFYYDRDCQMVFNRPSSSPVMLYDYTAQHLSDQDTTYPEEPLPEVTVEMEEEAAELLITLSVFSPKSMPYGAVVWQDLSVYTFANPAPAGCKILDNYLAFFRFAVKVGDNRICFILKKK